MLPSPPPSTPPLRPGFSPTRWTLVLRAQAQTPEAEQALSELCESYWDPVLRFLRSEGRSDDHARELTQEFFAHLLSGGGVRGAQPDRGRFRSYLLGALRHFLADRRDRENRLKRGGGQTLVSLDEAGPIESGITGDAATLHPGSGPEDHVFDQAWAFAVMDHALHALQHEFAAAGKSDQFGVLKPHLVGPAEALSHATAAGQLGVSEGAVKVAVHRLRRRFRELIRAELAQTVSQAKEVDEELRYLVEVLVKAAQAGHPKR